MPSYQFNVTVEVERESGKFAGRDEIEEALMEGIESGVDGASLDGLGADGESTYTIEDISIEAITPGRKR